MEEKTIDAKYGKGVYYSEIIGGKKYVSKIVWLGDLSEEKLKPWKERAKNQIINTRNAILGKDTE